MKAFLSYSRQDNEWVRGAGMKEFTAPPMMEWIKQQLAMIGVELWIDTRLEESIGEDFAVDIQTRLQQADLAIILVSQDFITSPFIASKEMAVIRQRVEKGEMRLFPIVVSAVIWQHNEMSEWISRFQLYPARNKPLQNEISSLKDMKFHRTEILRLLKNIVAERTGHPVPKVSGEPPLPHAPSSAIPFHPAVPLRRSRTPWLIGGIAVVAILVAAFFLAPLLMGKKDQAANAVNLPVPELRAESKLLDYPPATYGSRVVLDWTAFRVSDTDKFEVEISTSETFAESDSFTRQTGREVLVLERAQENSKLNGRHYWRVRLIRTKGKVISIGPWSDTGTFEVYDNAVNRIISTERLLVGTSALQNQPGDTIRMRGPGEYEGLDADVVAQVALRLKAKLNSPNLSVQFVNVAWKDLLPSVSRHQVDLAISGITATAKREQEYNVRFSRPYYSTAQVAMGLKSSGLTSLADALQRKAYGIEGRSGNEVAKAVFAKNEVAPGAAHYEKLFEVLRDHPDAVVVHDYAMLYAQAVWTGIADQYSFFPVVSQDLPEAKRKPFLVAHNYEDCDRWAIVVPDSQSELLNEINGCLDALDADGKLAQLIVHHNYPESSMQNCQVTLAVLRGQTEPPNEVKPQPKPSTSPAEPAPAANQKPEVETVPF